MTIFGGVDPGQKGCLTFWDENIPEVHHFIDMPLLKDADRHGSISINPIELSRELAALWKYNHWELRSYSITVEHLYIPRRNAKGLETSYSDFGVIQAALTRVGLVFELVRPATWQAYLGKPDGKEWSIEFAHRFYPHAELIKPGGKTPSDGRADALCIMEYGRRNLQMQRRLRRTSNAKIQ